MKKLAELFRHYQGTSIAIVIVIASLYWIYGCESKVMSIINMPAKVTRSELKIEIDAFLATAEIRYAELDKQDEFKKKVVEFAVIMAEGGTLNPAGVVVGLAAVLGVGGIVDNRKKDSLIKLLQNEKKKT